MSDLPPGPTTTDERPDGAPQPAPARAKRPPLSTAQRRTVIAVVMTLAIVGAIWANRPGSSSGHPDLDPAIVNLFPNDGAQALRQTEVGVDLKPGYDGRLTINGIAIPEAQMEGARDPKTTDPEDLRLNGIRPNNKEHVFFDPGPRKVIEELPQGTNVVTARYWQVGREQDTTKTVTWTFRAD